MLFNLKEFESLEEYHRWLTLSGERVRVISMTTLHKRWTVEGETVRPAGTPLYLVTFREVTDGEMTSEEQRCSQCGAPNASEFRFCSNCGTPLFKPDR